MNNNSNGCHCDKKLASDCSMTALPEDAATTMAYVPFQLDLSYYSTHDALAKGTLFCNLNKPFKGRCTK